MKEKLLVLNHSLLFLCTSMYLGTGWSLVLFSFPIAPDLTPDTYYNQFVPQVTEATQFFTYMTGLMLLLAAVMLVAEWRTPFRWIPIVVLLGVVAATGLTMAFILPYNAEMAAGITSQERLDEVLSRWMALNRIRVGLWTVQWLAMMAYFATKTYRSREMTYATRPAVSGVVGDLGSHHSERARSAGPA
jgi:hypothetical protein